MQQAAYKLQVCWCGSHDSTSEPSGHLGQHVVFFAFCYIKINLCCSLFTLRLLSNNYTFLVCNSVHKIVLRIITPKIAFLSVWKFCVITSDEVLREMIGYLMMGLPLRPT